MAPRPYSALDVAEMIGISLDTLYRTRARRQREGLPAPQQEHPLAWERSGFDAWRTRNHPLRATAPANDVVGLPSPDSDDDHRARLRRAYGGATRSVVANATGASACSSPARRRV
jgi:hypothetical protein